MVTYKDLAIVHTSVDINNEFIPNGYDIVDGKFPRKITFWDSDGFFRSHLQHAEYNNDRIFNIINKSVDEVTDDYLHIYSIENPQVNLNHFEEFDISFPKKIIEYTNTHKNFYIALFTEHEHGGNEQDFLSACNKFEKDGVNLKKLIIINNNSKLNEYKEKNKKNVLVHASHFLHASSTVVLRDCGSSFLNEKKGKFFISRNRTCNKLHRKNLMFDILRYKLENDINYSYININQTPDGPEYGLYRKYQPEWVIDNKTDLCKIVDYHYKECDYEGGLGYFNKETKEFSHQDKFSNLYLVPELAAPFENSYCNIVTESCFEEKNTIHITEKSLRPFHYYQFPIFLATHGHVKELRRNFDLFDDIIDHSYDDEPDFKKRYRMVINEILRINNNKNDFIKFYQENKNRFFSNKETLHSLAYECVKIDTDIFWNL